MDTAPLLKSQKWRLNNLYWIQDKQNNKLIQYNENKYQQLLRLTINKARATAGGSKVVVVKARQLGLTTGGVMYGLDRVLWGGVNGVVIGENQESTNDALNKAIVCLDNYRLSHCHSMLTTKETIVVKPNASYKALLTSRGGTVHWLHVTELAKIDHRFPGRSEEVRTGAIPSVPSSGDILIESTTQGPRGLFYELAMRAKESSTDWQLLFFPWYLEAAYKVSTPQGGQGVGRVGGLPTSPLSTTLSVTHDYQLKMIQEAKEIIPPLDGGVILSDEQLLWYRLKYDELGEAIRQEYPSTFEEAFLSTASPFYSMKRMGEVQVKKVLYRDEFIRELCWYEAREVCEQYKNAIIGIDVAEGIEGGDYTVVRVRGNDGVLLACYRGRCQPDEVPFIIDRIYSTGLRAVIAPERNNHGHALLVACKGYSWYYDIWREKKLDRVTSRWTMKIGWDTNSVTRPLMLDEHEEAIRKGDIEVDEYLLKEMMTFYRNSSGKPEALAKFHDDVIMADAICWQMRKYPIVRGFL